MSVVLTVVSVLSAAMREEQEKLHGPALHRVYTGLLRASQCLTGPRIHAYVHTLIHTYIQMVSERTLAVVVWPAISTTFHREVPKASRIIPQAFPKPSPNCIFSRTANKKTKVLT